MKKKQIKALWEKEKSEYSKHEIGSGVQNFVNEVLMSEDIFNIKKGKLSTKDSERRNEFLLEITKKRKRADAIIFISEDIIIPVETEKYKNIKAGERQIFNYQKAWSKKYGILTDGFIWHFYNVHFRPGRLPGSLSWTHGRVRHREMAREHPLEINTD